MKEQPPIKRHPAIVQFSRDHHFGLLLVWKIKQGLRNDVDAKRISSYVQFFFTEDLQNHFKEEEEELFSKLPPDDTLCEQAKADHVKIVKLVQTMTNDESNIALLHEFSTALDQHIRFEERTFFNYLQDHLTNSELDQLAAQHRERKVDIDDRWEDKFWEYKK